MSAGAYDYEMLYFSQSNTNEDSSKYFGISIFLHVALAIGTLFLTVPAIQKLSEPITIEITETPPMEIKPLVIEQSKGDRVKPTRGARMAMAPAPSATLDATPADVISAPVKKSRTSVSKMATLKTRTSGGKAAVAKSAPSRSGIPETIEDIPAPDLDFESVAAAQVGNLGEDEFENEFSNVDQKSDAALRAQKSEMDAEAKLIADEQEAALKSIEDQNLAQARAMDDSLKSTRTQNAATLAQIRAGERAAAERAAKAEADRLRKAALAGKGSGNSGRGRSDTGADEAAKNSAGTAGGIRTVDQLRQMPGNPKPRYSSEERLRRQQGQVIFHAFVTSDGHLEKVKIVRSTGYRNLDDKSLAVLKKWRFYPGQQGWVEIPQIWSLKGDVEEMPTLLRRKVSQR